MKSGIFARWLLRALGFLLALGGAAGMLRGWDIVQVERGWSLFIGGATALSGGAVVIALAEVVSRLDRLLAMNAPVAAASAKSPRSAQAELNVEPPPERAAQPAPQGAAAPGPDLPEPALEGAGPASAPPPTPAAPKLGPGLPPLRMEIPGLATRLKSSAAAPAPAPEAEGAREIERYQSGGLTYVMFSDGSVELRSEAGAQRFSSIEELRAVLATQG